MSVPYTRLRHRLNLGLAECSPFDAPSLMQVLVNWEIDDENFFEIRHDVEFRWWGSAENVKLTGSFTMWLPLPMTKEGNMFYRTMSLPYGDHLYNFIVDGQMLHDLSAPTGIGGDVFVFNVLTLAEYDFLHSASVVVGGTRYNGGCKSLKLTARWVDNGVRYRNKNNRKCKMITSVRAARLRAYQPI